MDSHTQWCRNLFNMLAEGGTWGIPRSGLIFNRRGDQLVLVNRMPHDPDMPMAAVELARQQQSDYRAVKREFAKADITVIDLT